MASKTGSPLVIQPSHLFTTDKSDQAPTPNPHRSTPASVRTPPAVSSLEAFRTPASVHPLAPVPGRRPKTLNDSGHSQETAIEPARFDPIAVIPDAEPERRRQAVPSSLRRLTLLCRNVKLPLSSIPARPMM